MSRSNSSPGSTYDPSWRRLGCSDPASRVTLPTPVLRWSHHADREPAPSLPRRGPLGRTPRRGVRHDRPLDSPRRTHPRKTPMKNEPRITPAALRHAVRALSRRSRRSTCPTAPGRPPSSPQAAALALHRPARRQPGPDRPHDPGAQAPHVRPARAHGLQGDRGRLPVGQPDRLRLRPLAHRGATSSPTTSRSRC